MFKRIFTAAVLFGAAATAPPVYAQAQIPCGPRTALVDVLTETRGEQRVAGGLQNSQRMIEIWASAETGSFSILLTFADGSSCLLGTGTHFRILPVMPQAEGVHG